MEPSVVPFITSHGAVSILFSESSNRPYRFYGAAHSAGGFLPGNRRTTPHKIGGTVTVDGQPAERMVVAVDRRTFKFVAATTSHPETGEWIIEGIETYPERTLIVFAIDGQGQYNAEVADFISQVATNPVLPTEAEVD